MEQKKPNRLKKTLVIAALCAFAAWHLHGRLLAGMGIKRGDAPVAAVYAAVFLLSFMVLSFLSRHIHISITLRARRGDPDEGMTPKAARVFVIAALFLIPLGVLLDPPRARDGLSLNAVIEAGEKKARAALEDDAKKSKSGYSAADRARIEKILLEKEREEKGHDGKTP